VLPELLDLFDPACNKDATAFNISVTDEDFARYDREDQHGNKISLNEQQREAFTKLLNYGPLSLLQGPPGTGKTEFIAAFVHFLVEKLNVRRILLVSQSHEAVNTAAERIRKHCGRLGTSLEVVRFSNREGAVSHGLKDVYSHAITAEKRELFNAEYRYRVAALSDALGLDAEFISKVVEAELKLFKQIDHLESLLKNSRTLATRTISKPSNRSWSNWMKLSAPNFTWTTELLFPGKQNFGSEIHPAFKSLLRVWRPTK
jgi:hypothetical protein